MDDAGANDLKYCKNCMEPLESGQMVCPVCGYDNSITHHREPVVKKNTDPNVFRADLNNGAAVPEPEKVSGMTGRGLESITRDPEQPFSSAPSYSHSDPAPYSDPDPYSYPNNNYRSEEDYIRPAGTARRMPVAQPQKRFPWIWILIPVLLGLFILLNIFLFWKIRNDRKQVAQTAAVVLSPGVGITPTVNAGSGAGALPTSAAMALDPISMKYTEIAQTQMAVVPTATDAAGGGMILRPTEGQAVDPIAIKYTEIAQTQMAVGAFYPTATPQPPAVTGSDIRVGAFITLGHYEQDGDLTDGAEPIEWQVLAVDDGWALLVSRYGLLVRDYHTQGSSDMQEPYGGSYDQQIPFDMPYGGSYDQQTPYDILFGGDYDMPIPYYFRLGTKGFGMQNLNTQRNGRQSDYGSQNYGREMEQRPDISWKDCELRTWLNADFFNTAFSSEEQGRIKEVITEKASGSSFFGFSEDITDRIFLLTTDMVDQYIPDGEARKCYAVQNAAAEGAYRDQATGASPWWIRSSSNGPSIVDPYGTVGAEIRSEYIDGIVVRPALALGL